MATPYRFKPGHRHHGVACGASTQIGIAFGGANLLSPLCSSAFFVRKPPIWEFALRIPFLLALFPNEEMREVGVLGGNAERECGGPGAILSAQKCPRSVRAFPGIRPSEFPGGTGVRFRVIYKTTAFGGVIALWVS